MRKVYIQKPTRMRVEKTWHANVWIWYVCVWNSHECRSIFIYIFANTLIFPEHTPECDFNTHECNFSTQSVNFTGSSVILTRLSVISARRVAIFTHKCNLDTYECGLDTQTCYCNTLRVILKLINWN
jgi:hypothetical protein